MDKKIGFIKNTILILSSMLYFYVVFKRKKLVYL